MKAFGKELGLVWEGVGPGLGVLGVDIVRWAGRLSAAGSAKTDRAAAAALGCTLLRIEELEWRPTPKRSAALPRWPWP